MNQASGSAPTHSEWRASWTVVLAAAAGMSLSAVSTSTIGVVMEPLEREFGWTRTQITLGPSLISFIAMALATFAGLTIDKLGARKVAIVAAALMSLGIGLMSAIGNHLWQWWGLWALIGVTAATMPTVWLSPISTLFTKGRGLAMALTLSGTGISTSLVPIVANQLVESHGWRGAYIGIAAIWAAFVLPLIFIFFRTGRRPSPVAAEQMTSTTSDTPLPGLTVKQGFASPAFYKLGLAAFLSTVAGVGLILNLVPVLTSTGITRGSAAAIAGSLGVATIVGRIVSGWMMDKFNASFIAATATAGAIILPALLLLFPGSVPAAITSVIIYGTMGGAKIPAIAYLASRHLGSRAFGTLYGAISSMVALSVGLGPLFANLVFDMTKSYEIVMWAAVPIFMIAAVLYASMGSYPDFCASDDAEPAS